MSLPAASAPTFDPPSSYAFEPELTGPPPRPLADSVLDGPYARDRRKTLVRLTVIGLVCFVLPYVPGIDTLAYYILPLGYLNWIGLAALVIAAGAAVRYTLRLGAFRYLRFGEPLAARVEQVSVQPSRLGHGSVNHVARLVYRHPQTGAMAETVVRSADIGALYQSRYAVRFKAGDYATAVYLPGKKVEKSLRLYAFLDLSPEVNIRAESAASALRAAVGILAVVAFLVLLLGNVYAMERYAPLDDAVTGLAIAAGVGAVALGAVFIVFLRAIGRPRVLAMFGGALIGAMTGACWSLLLNAWLDRSPAANQPATVVEFWTKTYEFLVRSYEIEYRLGPEPRTRRLLSTMEEMERFRAPEAVARIRAGAFGWRWVESLEPAAEGRAAQKPGLRDGRR
jgi:hypothetical protein